MTRGRRFTLLGLLYVAQALPLGFFVIALPAILRARGVGVERIGMLAVLALPFLLKFAWAPLVDRWGRPSGHYRSWLLPLQLGSIVVVGWMAGIDPVVDVAALVITGALFMLLAATQDIATDGLAVRLLEAEERGFGNGIQVGGYYLGQIVGGGVILVVVDRWGWAAGVGAVALLLALPIPLVATLREPSTPPSTDGRRVGMGDLLRFFGRPGMGAWVVVLLLWRAGETMATWMVNPMLIDRGFSLEQVGLTLGMCGSTGALAGALLGGWSVKRWGRFAALLGTGAIAALCLLVLLIPAGGFGGWPALVLAAVAVAFGGGAATAALYTAAMDASRRSTAGTDFTLQQSLAAIGPLLAAGISGFSVARLGYGGHFSLAAAVQIGVVGIVATSAGLRRGIADRAAR
jgi:predicted MFS family arabinose efflux permease